jgi:outer membrane protein assembly factor BamD
MKPVTRSFLLIFMALILVSASGCSVFKGLFGESGQAVEAQPQTLAYEGVEQLNAENYKTAAEIFQRLKDRYPYSRYAILAELKLADALYLEGKYIEAADAYMEFERLHPKNEAVPYVIYQQGMCYFQQVKGPHRDPTPAVRAIQTFARLRLTYPDSKFSSMAVARLTEAQNALAGHEFYVGEFYFKKEAYKAALGRFLSLLKNYPDTGYHGPALDYIRLCRIEMAAIAAEEAEEQGETPEKEEKALPPIDIEEETLAPPKEVTEPPKPTVEKPSPVLRPGGDLGIPRRDD